MSRISSTSVSQTAPRRSGLSTAAVLAFFFVSGGCGLLYQVVWTRKLVLLFGATSYAVGTVLFIFFLGMGLGSLWGARLANRTQRPLFLYGLFEVVIAIWAVVFILLVMWGEGVVVGLLRATAMNRAAGVGLRAALATAFLIVPVTMMGATLPLLTRYVARERRAAGLRVGALYSLNTFGAVAGCALAGFVLLAQLGYTRTTLIGGAANALVGVLAMLLSARRERGLDARASERAAAAPARATTDPAEAPPSAALIAGVYAAFALSGFCSIALEVLWTRLLTIVFTGTTYAYTTMLASLLCGLALGSTAATLIADRTRRHVAWFGMVQALAGFACIATLWLIARSPDMYESLSFDTSRSWEALLRVKFIVSFAVLLAPTFLLGAGFPFAVKAVAGFRGRIGRDVGLLYALNTFGGTVGALAGGFVVIPLLGTHMGILALGAIPATAGILLILGSRRYAFLIPAAAGLALVVMQGPVRMPHVGLTLTERDIPPDNALIHFVEGIEGTVAVTDEPGEGVHTERVLWINGVQATASIEQGVKMNRFQAALPLLLDRPMREGLLMCFGSGITCGTLALHEFDRLDAVEISPEVLDAARFFAEDNLDVMDNPRVTFHVDDGRNYLLTRTRTYDLITFEPMPLALSGVSTFYTREYYALCRSRLNPGGVVSQWIPLHSLTPEIVRSLARTFTDVFPEYAVWYVNADLFFLGSDQPIRIDYARAAERLSDPGLKASLARVELDDVDEVICQFVMGKAGVDAFAGSARIMRDDRPWAEFEAPKHMNTRDVVPSLVQLQGLLEDPTPYVDFSGLDAAAAEEARARIALRARAKREYMRGLLAYRGGMLSAETADGFLAALAIDPDELGSRYYLRDIAENLVAMYLGWSEFENATAFLDKVQAARPDIALFELLRGDVAYAQEQYDAAAAHYRRYIEMGGAASRARERVGEAGAGMAASE